MNLAAFVERFKHAVTDAVIRTYPPLYDATVRDSCGFDLRRLLRRPLGGQADAIRATALSIQRHRGTNVVGEMGSGKAQPLDAQVLTPTGWKRMGDVRVGDRLIDPKGGTSTVTGVYPQGPKQIYRVTFSDGSSTECCGEHLWLVNSPLRKWRGRPARVRSLEQILAHGLMHVNGNLQHFVPLVAAAEFASLSERPLDPYVLGLLLGDGSLTTRAPVFTTLDEELASRVASALPEGVDMIRKDRATYCFRATTRTMVRRDDGRCVPASNALVKALEVLGLLGKRSEDKFVPSTYLYAPVAVRTHLLQGLLDADGCPSGRGSVEYATVSPHLADDVTELVWSLGGTVTRSSRYPRYRHGGEVRHGELAYRLALRLPAWVHPFALKRKADRYQPGSKYGPTRAIARVEPVGIKRAQCIAVDSKSQLYVTDDYIVTHNTYIAAAAAYLAGCRRVFVICPPHLVKKWRREIQHTVPGARVAIVRTMTDLDRAVLPLARPTRPVPTGQLALTAALSPPMHVVVCSREQAKLGYRWIGAAVRRPARDERGRLIRDDAGQVIRRLCCPACFHPALDDEDVPLLEADLERKKVRCRACDGPLWQADRRGPRRYPLADYVRRRFPRHFDLLIVDEVHEMKARGSAQGVAGATLAGVCEKTLALSGTIFGGYSSTLFYVLWRFSAAIRSEFGYRDEARWVSRYGVIERITRRDDDACIETGRQSKRKGYLTRTIEKPGVAPSILFHLIGNTVFLRLSDVARDLPPYSERVLLVPLDDTPLPAAPADDGGRAGGHPDERDERDAPTQARCYHRLASELRQAVTGALRAGSKRLLGTYLQALLTYPDACTQAETVVDPRSGEVIAHAPALPDDVLYPKERALIEMVRRERGRQRRVLVYVTHTEKRDLTPRLRAVLEREGFRVAVLKANTVRADLREEWLAARVKEGVDVLLAHPRLVQTGLDLIDWPSLAWYEPEYSIYVMRQASRRSWRIGQRLPVEMTYMVYERTLQAQALSLVAAKMRSALLIDGELPQDGLAALGTDDHDVFLALARQLAAQADASGAGAAAAGEQHSLEALFAQARQAEAEDNDLLVEGDWEPRGTGDGERAEDVPAAVALHLPAGEAAARWSEVFSGTSAETPSPAPHQTDAPVAGRLVTFDQLAHLVRRPKARPRSVPHGQLTLFDADAAQAA